MTVTINTFSTNDTTQFMTSMGGDFSLPQSTGVSTKQATKHSERPATGANRYTVVTGSSLASLVITFWSSARRMPSQEQAVSCSTQPIGLNSTSPVAASETPPKMMQTMITCDIVAVSSWKANAAREVNSTLIGLTICKNATDENMNAKFPAPRLY